MFLRWKNFSRYHLGTVAFGSAIISLCELIKSLIESARNENYQSGNFDIAAVATECMFMCCEGLLKFVQYVSGNAYIMCGLHGTDFITSAKDAFNLIMRNVSKVIATTYVITKFYL